jgi:hypothetical protein
MPPRRALPPSTALGSRLTRNDRDVAGLGAPVLNPFNDAENDR